MWIREITPQDAGTFIQLVKQVDSESDYMLMEPGEKNISLEEHSAKG